MEAEYVMFVLELGARRGEKVQVTDGWRCTACRVVYRTEADADHCCSPGASRSDAERPGWWQGTPSLFAAASVTPDSIDTTNAPQTINLGVRVHGAYHGVPADRQVGALRIASPTGRQGIDAPIMGADLVSGDRRRANYRFRVSLTLPEGSEAGRWTVVSVDLVDLDGRRAQSRNGQLNPDHSGHPVIFTVAGVDRSAPAPGERQLAKATAAARAALEAQLASHLDPDGGDVDLANLLRCATVDALTAIAQNQTDEIAAVDGVTARQALPWADELIAGLIRNTGDPIDTSDPDELGELVDSLTEDHDGHIEQFIASALGGSTLIGTVGEDASYSPMHSSSKLYLESFTREGNVWYFGTGDPDVLEPYVASFLYREGDREGRRQALVDLAGSWAGAGLEDDDDPEVRSAARSNSWFAQMDIGDPSQPLAEWELWGADDSADELVRDHAALIARRLEQPVEQVAAAIRTIKHQEREEEEEEEEEETEGREETAVLGEKMSWLVEQAREELWWILRCADR